MNNNRNNNAKYVMRDTSSCPLGKCTVDTDCPGSYCVNNFKSDCWNGGSPKKCSCSCFGSSPAPGPSPTPTPSPSPSPGPTPPGADCDSLFYPEFRYFIRGGGFELCGEDNLSNCDGGKGKTCGELLSDYAKKNKWRLPSDQKDFYGCITRSTDGSQTCLITDEQGRVLPKMICDEIKGIDCVASSPSPGPGPSPSPGPTPSSAPSDPTTLILAIGGGIFGLVIISLIIYYAVQRGKTKQQALKVNTNADF